MIRLGLLLLLCAGVGAAESEVGFDTAATLYQAAEVRAQVRASLGSMPEKMRRLYSADESGSLSEDQLAAVETSATHGFRIDVFEPAAIAAMGAGLDAAAAKGALEFLHGASGQRMVAADVALAQEGESTLDKISSGELAAPANPERDAILDKIQVATHTVDSAVQIYLAIARALAIGTAIGGGLDPIAADQRAARNSDATVRATIAQRMQGPLRRSLAYGYRDLSTADLRNMLTFFGTKAGKKYTLAYIAAMNAGFDAMGRRCGERIGERWRELAVAQRATTTRAATMPPDVP
jgi:hypothetical protein